MSHHPNPLDESLQLLEEELTHLRPLPPTEGLQARILGALASADAESEAPVSVSPNDAKRLRSLWFGALPLAAAAAVALLAVVLVRPAAPPAPGPSGGVAVSESPGDPEIGPALDLRPVSAESRLVREQDEGVTREAQGVYSLQRRRHYLETRDLRDAKTGTVIRINVPREEVVREPLDVQ